MYRSAIISKDKKFRYELTRKWSEMPMLTYIMLNPSKANDKVDDSTVKRLIFFSKKFGYGGFFVGNIFPKITPYIKELYKDTSHDIKKNTMHIESMINKSSKVVYAWGNSLESTPIWISKIVKNPYCFGFNKNGSPKHPLYLNGKTLLIKF